MDVHQAVTSNRKDIPSHYVPIASFGCHNGKFGKKQTPEYSAVYAAWCDEAIGGFKFMSTPRDKNGQIFVDPTEASRIIEAAVRPRSAPQPQPRPQPASIQYESVCESLADIATSLAAVERLLERLATAAESIATQPQKHDFAEFTQN